MSRVSWRPLPGLERPALVAAPGRVAVLCAVVVALIALRRQWWHLAAFTAAVVIALTVGQIQRRVEKRRGVAWK
jgi:hypothetical protein